MEAAFGAEPGRKLNTKEALIKYTSSLAMFGGDMLWLVAKLKGTKIPENVFMGRTIVRSWAVSAPQMIIFLFP